MVPPRSSLQDGPEAVTLWRTMLRTMFSLRHAVRPVFATHALTGPQWQVLRALGEAEAAGLTLGDIAGRLLHSPGNTTGIVDKLEESGLARRVPHPEDRRAILVTLTDAGREIYQTVEPALAERTAELFSCLTPAEQATLEDLFSRLLAHVRDLPTSCGDSGHCSDPSR